MLISRNWLQRYFEQPLPDANSLAQTLLLHSFEIEGVEHTDTDSIIDIDVLPNRAHDCLCHYGIAKELSGLLSLPIITQEKEGSGTDSSVKTVKVTIDNTDKCRRYAAVRVNNVTVTDSPQWLADSLKSLGQKRINTIVDATNYVMFDIGQPLHAFDADKVVGGITIRNANDGEIMTALTGEELTLTPEDLVIADDEGILALAGVKGGKKAEVTRDTKNIILEIANFDPVTVRQTSRRVKIQTDSSKRFENEISVEVIPQAIESLTTLITSLSDGAVVSPVTIEGTYIQEPKIISVSYQHITRVLGCEINPEEILGLFKRFAIKVTYSDEVFEVTVPAERLDLTIPEDIIEEIGRWYGYHNIPSASVDTFAFKPQVNSATYYENAIKNILIDEGYTELLTYTFVNKGEVTLYNPIAQDKKALRTELEKSLVQARDINERNASFFGTNHIGVFEIGRVYTDSEEPTLCTITCINADKRAKKERGTEREQLEQLCTLLQEQLKITFDVVITETTMTFSLDELTGTPDSYESIFEHKTYPADAEFRGVSVYPYSTRDVSLWVTEGTTAKAVEAIIRENAGEYLKKCYLFDEFTKEGKTSYAFSLVFQSDEKTLEEGDIDSAMMSITNSLEQKGWEIR